MGTYEHAGLSRREFLAGAAAVGLAVLAGVSTLPGAALAGTAAGTTYTVYVEKGYLALRSAKSYNAANEIGALHTGDTVQVQSVDDPVYWYVYAPSLGRSGYVNRTYLRGAAAVGATYEVRVAKGYLALRSAQAYDASNELGALYTGDTVQVRDTCGGGTYWYVYSPRYQRMGYVNAKYLVASSGGVTGCPYTVSVAKGYLALRSQPSYDASNELGALYTGEVVYAVSGMGGTYWWVYSPKHNSYGYVNAQYLR